MVNGSEFFGFSEKNTKKPDFRAFFIQDKQLARIPQREELDL